MDLKSNLLALQEAKDDIEKLESLSNQFRTCFLMVIAPPSMTINGDPEMKNFMEVQKSRIEKMELDEHLAWIDAYQAHLALHSRLAREQSKVKIKIEVDARAQKDIADRDIKRALKGAKSKGETFVDTTDGEKVRNNSVLNTGVEPVDKRRHKAIQGMMKSLGVNYQSAKAALESMEAQIKQGKEN